METGTGKQDLHDHTWQDVQDKFILQIMPAFRRSFSSCSYPLTIQNSLE
jgi:hypothetical protein